MTEELVVLVRLKAKPGMEEELRGSLIVDRARTEPGVKQIVVYEDINDPGLLLLHETFTNGTVTICGTVQPGTHFDPDTIAQSYLALHQRSPVTPEIEVIYK